MTDYIATVSFRDENMPNFGVTCGSENSARNELSIMLKQFAALKGGWITRPDGTKLVFNPAGEYMFTVPKI